MLPNDRKITSSSNSSSLLCDHLCHIQPTLTHSSQSSSPFISSPVQQAHHVTTRHQCVATLEGQKNSYKSSLVLTQNFLYTGSSDREIHAWKLDTCPSDVEPNYKNVTSVRAGKGAVKALVVSSDKLISAHQDHKIRVWKIDGRNMKIVQLATLPTLSDRALKLLVPKSRVRIRRHKKRTWVHHVDTVSALAMSRDESLLYSVSWDRSLKIWRTNDFRCLESVANAHDDSINAIVVSRDGYLYTASSDRKIKLWKQISGDKTHSLVDTLEKHGSGINALALSSNGSVLYSGACDGLVFVWENVGSGGMEVVGALTGHTKAVLCLTAERDLVFSGSADNTVRIWSQKTCCCSGVIEGHKGPVKCIVASVDHSSPDGVEVYMLYSSSLDCNVKVWKISVPMYSQVHNRNHN